MKLLCLTLVLGVSAIPGWALRQKLARVASAEAQIGTFATALSMFDEDCGRYPTTSEGLAALIKQPRDVPAEIWHKYLQGDLLPNDPWGHPYVYRCPGLHNTITFDVYSWGPDGKSKSGGEDPGEIGNWEPAPEVVTTGHWGPSGIAEVGAAAFVVVLALAWAERRFWKSEGNLHGVHALLWLAAAPALWMALPGGLGVRFLGPLGCVALCWGWLAALFFWTISGHRRGSPFSKFCAYVVIILMIVVVLLFMVAIVVPSFS